MDAFYRTLVLMFTSATIAMVVGWTYAYLSERMVRRGLWFWRAVPLISISLPLFIHAAAWEATLGKFGWVTFSAVDARNMWFAGGVASALIHGITGTAWVALVVGAWLGRGYLPGEQAARLEAGPWRSAFYVTFPSSMPITGLAGIWVALIAATEISVVDLYGFRTLADEVYFQYAISPQPLPLVAAALLPLLITVTAFAFAAIRFYPFARPLTSGNTPPLIRRPGGAQSLVGFSALSVLAGLMLVLPISSLLIKAGWTVAQVDGQMVPGWSLAQTIATIVEAATAFGMEFRWTAWLSATVIAMTLPLSHFVAVAARRHPNPVALACLALLFVPGPVVGFLVMRLMSDPRLPWLNVMYDRTLIPTSLCIMHQSVPVCCLILMGAYQLTGRRATEAARIDGASTVRRWLSIELPQMRTAFALCAIVAGVITLGDISSSELVLPPGVSTVARRVFGLLHSGVRYQESGLCLISALIVVAIVSAGKWSFGRQSRQKRHK